MAEQENKNQIPRSQNAERASDSVQSGLTSKKPQLTIAEIQRIAALPRKKMRVSDTIQDVIIDEKTGYVYFPNPKPKMTPICCSQSAYRIRRQSIKRKHQRKVKSPKIKKREQASW